MSEFFYKLGQKTGRAPVIRKLVVILHVWKRNPLLSIIGGTVCYMLLVQLVF